MDYETFDKVSIANEIRNHFEKNDGWAFSLELHRLKHLYQNLLPEEDKEKNIHVWFRANTDGFKWAEIFSLKLIKDQDGNELFEFESDFSVSGILSYSIEENIYNEKNIPVFFELTLKIYKYPSLSISHKDIQFWDNKQKIINHYNAIIQDKYEELSLKSIIDQFEQFTNSWLKVDKTKENQVYSTSYYYFYEIVYSYEQLMYLIANVNLYKNYTSDYLQNESNNPWNHYKVNLTFGDRRYLDFCSLAFEKLYNYWERLAFLIFQFIQPDGLSKNPKKMSFSNLIKELYKDIEKGNYPHFKNAKSCFKWFKAFFDKDHKALSNFRHSQIHFQKDNPIYKGGFYSGTLIYWLQNNGDKSKIQQLQKENENLCDFLTNQFQNCKIGFEKSIELIKEIP